MSYSLIRHEIDQYHIDNFVATAGVASHPVGTFGRMMLLNLASSDSAVPREQAWQLYRNVRSEFAPLMISYSDYAHGEFGLELVRGGAD